jgi:hypothetical protein
MQIAWWRGWVSFADEPPRIADQLVKTIINTGAVETFAVGIAAVSAVRPAGRTEMANHDLQFLNSFASDCAALDARFEATPARNGGKNCSGLDWERNGSLGSALHTKQGPVPPSE